MWEIHMIFRLWGFFSKGRIILPSQRAETEILSNYIYVDEKSGMDVQRDVWQEKTEYANGITFWIEDPGTSYRRIGKITVHSGLQLGQLFC